MLCDIPVYNIAEDVVLNKTFCPFIGSSDTKKAYERWRSNRIYLKTNRAAERIVKNTGGNSTREAKRRLSLSDGYWVKYGYDEKTLFASITPYLNPFSMAYVHSGGKRSSSVPELVLGGSQPKLWGRGSDGVTYMRKTELSEQIHAEMLAVKLARKCGIKVMNAFIITEKGKIYADNYPVSQDYSSLGVINLVNITNVNRSLIQFDQLGVWVRGYDPASVAEGYNKAGVEGNQLITAQLQIVFDGIIGNTDRELNNSNWAVFMDNNTGKRIPSFMYDFNWASLGAENELGLQHIISYIKRAGTEKLAAKQAEHICHICTELGLETWESNAKRLLKGIE